MEPCSAQGTLLRSWEVERITTYSGGCFNLVFFFAFLAGCFSMVCNYELWQSLAIAKTLTRPPGILFETVIEYLRFVTSMLQFRVWVECLLCMR